MRNYSPLPQNSPSTKFASDQARVIHLRFAIIGIVRWTLPGFRIHSVTIDL